MTQREKLPPFSGDAEASIIGSLLIDDRAIVRVSLLLKPADFFREANRWAYEGCLALYRREEAINQITLADELERRGKLAEAGGPAYLAACVADVPTSLHAEYYASIVKRTSVNRQLVQVAGQIAALGYEDGAETEAVLGRAEQLLFALRQASPAKGLVPLREALERCAADMANPRGEPGEAVRVLTGYHDLDRILGGLHASDLIILAGRPGHGKTSLCLNIAEQVAVRLGAKVAMFSLEMSVEQLAYRFVGSHAAVDLQRLMLWRLNHAELNRVSESLGVLSELSVYVDDTANQRVSEIRGRAKLLATQTGVDLVMVDYAGLVRGTGRAENRVQEIGEVTRELKALAKDLNVPVLLAAQLSRAVEQRPDHRPILSDLRESGDLEQNADVVLFIYREDQYIDEDHWQRKNPLKPYPKGGTEIIIAKHRNGPTGSIKLLFREEITRFQSMELHREEPQEGYYWQS